MEKYKICPACGTRNNPLLLECAQCEADLQNVPVVDEATERMAEGDDRNGAMAPQEHLIRLCDCGMRNPVQARRCSACGEDIFMIVPTPDTPAAELRYVLSSLDGAYAYEVQEGTVQIGRQQEMQEYLAAKPYVSRKHAALRLDRTAGKLIIQNCNATNYTFVNNQILSGEDCMELSDGDEIGLGGNEQNGARQDGAAYFLVRIGPCT